MHKGQIKSCDTVENLRRNLQRYDELIINGKSLGSETLDAIKTLPFVISADFGTNNGIENTLVIQAENLKKHLNTILESLLNKGVQINGIETNEPTLEDIFVDTIEHGGSV